MATDEFSEWFLALSALDQERVQRAVRRIETTGPTLGRPYADTVYGSDYMNMKEMRIPEPPIRIFFAFDPTRTAVLLLAGDKGGTRRFYTRMIAQADALYSEHLASLKE